MVNQKIVVWDLFGGGQNSVYNALKNNQDFDVYTFDITKPTRNKQFDFDLAQPNIYIYIYNFQKQHNIPNPDVIVSSPLCQSFSSVISMKGGGTAFWKLNKNKDRLIFRSKKEFNKLKSGFTKNFKADDQLFVAKLGKLCIDNTIEIITKYQPKCWYIENPRTSLMWKYIQLNKKQFVKEYKPYFNLASYGKYGFPIRKDTYFLSNTKMDLLNGKVKPPYHIEYEKVNASEVAKATNRQKMYVNKNGQWFKKWYVKNGHFLTEGKKFATLFPKDAGLGSIQKIDNKQSKQKTKKTTRQICESGSVSHIPPKLIREIFRSFKF